MIINTAELNSGDRHYQGSEPSDILEIGNDPHVRVSAPINYDITARRVGSEILARGRLTLAADFMCSRCAEWFQRTLRVDDFLRLVPAGENESIDLTPDIREDILLALPIISVCTENCRGLCAGCGTNLNVRPCVCREEHKSTVWHVLDGLDIK